MNSDYLHISLWKESELWKIKEQGSLFKMTHQLSVQENKRNLILRIIFMAEDKKQLKTVMWMTAAHAENLIKMTLQNLASKKVATQLENCAIFFFSKFFKLFTTWGKQKLLENLEVLLEWTNSNFNLSLKCKLGFSIFHPYPPLWIILMFET